MVATVPLPLPNTFTVVAHFVGERVDTRSIGVGTRLADFPVLVRSGREGVVALFRYGVVVCFALDAAEQASVLKHLGGFLAAPLSEPETESVDVRIDPDTSEHSVNGVLVLRDTRAPRLQALAEILAKSVVLAFYEKRMNALFEHMEPVARDIESGGRGGVAGKDLLRHIGGALLVEHTMVGRVEVGEKPEFLWDEPDVERLWVRLEDDYEIVERNVSLERKLDLVSKTAETLLQLSNENRALRVEWYIVALIVFEILLTLYQMFVRD
ncbi:MAG: RMD1 family protein [Planctomycetes bacterium]|nr:RMD1 family protein [Planctomycetota bacterium]